MSWQAFCREEAYDGNDWQPIGPTFDTPEEATAFATDHHNETDHTTRVFPIED